MATLPMSPKVMGGSRTVTLSSANQNSNQENTAQHVNTLKNVQRIRLKKKSEPQMTPLSLAAQRSDLMKQPP